MDLKTTVELFLESIKDDPPDRIVHMEDGGVFVEWSLPNGGYLEAEVCTPGEVEWMKEHVKDGGYRHWTTKVLKKE